MCMYSAIYVCSSVTSWCSIGRLCAWIEPIFGRERILLRLCYTVVEGNFDIAKNKLTSFWILFQTTLNLADFSAKSPGRLTVARVFNLVQLSQVYQTGRPPLSTTRWPWRRASRGSSAIAETCWICYNSFEVRNNSACYAAVQC